MLGKRSRSYVLENPQHRSAEAERLDRQARLLFPLEREELVRHGVAPGQTLLDLGCGQGTFLSLLASGFAGARCVGLDRNRDFLDEAKGRPGVAAAECDVADGSALRRELQRHRPDVALSRFVLQHMSAGERRTMLLALAEHAADRELRVVLADVDGESSFVDPPSVLLAEARAGLNAIQQRHGGDRSVGARLGDLLRQAGFADVRESRLRVTSDAVGFDAFWAAFGSLLCAGLHARPSAQQALVEWAADPATSSRWRFGFDLCFASSVRVGPPHA